MNLVLGGLGGLVAAGLLGVAYVRKRTADRDRAAARFAPKGQIIAVKGCAVHVKIEGHGPPLILLHGASGNLRDFNPLIDNLRTRYTVVRFDRPGLGHSTLPARYDTLWRRDAPSPLEQARILAAAYHTLDLGPAVVLGQSFGGAVALAWALEHPADVSALIPLSAVSNHWTQPLDPMYRINSHPLGAALLVPLISAFATAKGLAPLLDKIFAPQAPPPRYTEMIGLDLSLRHRTLVANARQVYLLRDAVAAQAKRYSAIKCPVEILHGDADGIVALDIHATRLAEQIAGAKLTVLPGIGHMPHHAAPEAVIDAIDRAAHRAGLLTTSSLGTRTS